MNDRFVVGAGGHGRVVLEVWRAAEPDSSFAFIDDDPALQGREVAGVKVAGPVSMLAAAQGQAILALGNNPIRQALAQRLGDNVEFGRAIHPSATVFPSASVAAGCMIFAGAVVNTGASLERHVIVNSAAIVEHDCLLEECVTVSPGACMGGRVHLERGVFISVGTTIAPRVRIGAGTVVGAGSVVVSDLPSGVLAYGVPARIVRELTDDFDWRRLL